MIPKRADNYGRKKALYYTVGIGAFSVIFGGFSFSIYQFMISFFLAGFGFTGFETISLVYVSEISSKF